jgi:hypothetical protein
MSVLQFIARFLHIASAGTLLGGFQMLTAPEAETNGDFPLYHGFWKWDKSIAVGLLTVTGLYNFFIVYLPKLQTLPRDNSYRKRYSRLLAIKCIIFAASIALTYVNATITTLVVNYCLILIMVGLAIAMKSARETGIQHGDHV